MAKQATSFRLSETTIHKVNELSELFRESGGEVVERAVNLLYDNREAEAKRDLEDRLNKISKK